MHRRDFLSTVSFGIAGACACGLAACSKSSGSNTVVPPGSVNFSVDLDFSLQHIGDSIINSGVIVTRIDSPNLAASFSAVAAACTHEGAIIHFDESSGVYKCPLHGSEFSTTGAVLQGPASTSLQKYKTSVSGSTLTVKG